MKFRAIVIKPSSTGGGFDAAVDDKVAIGLCLDEALGFVASILFGSAVIYARTLEQEAHWHERYRAIPSWVQPEQMADFKATRDEYAESQLAHARDLLSAVGIVSMAALPRAEVAHG